MHESYDSKGNAHSPPNYNVREPASIENVQTQRQIAFLTWCERETDKTGRYTWCCAPDYVCVRVYCMTISFSFDFLKKQTAVKRKNHLDFEMLCEKEIVA